MNLSDKAKRRVEILIHAAFYGLILLLVYIAFRSLHLFLPLILACILVAIANPLVRFINRKIKIKQSIIAVVVTALLYLVAGGILFFIGMQIILTLKHVFTILPAYYTESIAPTIENLSAFFEGTVASIPEEWAASFQTVQETVMDALKNAVLSLSSAGVSILTDMVQGVPDFLIAMVFTILLSFFVSIQHEKIYNLIFNGSLPEKVVSKATEVIDLLRHTVFEYSKAILKLMFITFIELSIGFFVVGIENPVGTAALIALFDALPVFGTGGIMIPWIILELLKGEVSVALSLGILYIIITVIRNIIEPKIIGDQLELNPIVSLASIYVGFKLFGFLGMIFFPILTKIVLTLYENGFFGIKPKKLRDKEAGEGSGSDDPDGDDTSGPDDPGGPDSGDPDKPDVPGDGELLIPANENPLT